MFCKVFTALLSVISFLPLAADVVLVQNGVAQGGISFDPEYNKVINKYAQILNDYIQKSSGAIMPVNAQKTQTAIAYLRIS